jgi:putative PIG3 family NAD(P)H quinone oxidoreductase
MRALRIRESSGPTGLELADVAEPALGPTDLRVQVKASAVNRADLLQTLGRYPAPPDAPPDIPGLEYAGEVIEVGARAGRFPVGAKVMGLVGGGAWAEQVVVNEREAIPVPAGLTWAQAGAVPEAFLTAFDAVRLQGDLAPSEWLLVHAVASGVGTAAAQLAHAMGAQVIGTARSADKLARVRALGVAHTIHVQQAPPLFAAEVVERTGGGAHVGLELVGGEYLPQTLAAMAPRGRVLVVGTLAGAKAGLDLSVLMRRRLTLKGTVLRTRPLEEKAQLARAFEHELLPMFERQTVRPLVDATYPMQDAAAALERLSRNESFGKLVLAW